jgi:hypothetical protein
MHTKRTGSTTADRPRLTGTMRLRGTQPVILVEIYLRTSALICGCSEYLFALIRVHSGLTILARGCGIATLGYWRISNFSLVQ